jgi:hypothetical protein
VQNVQSFAYVIASVMPWRKHPQRPTGPQKTYAGAIVSTLDRLVKDWVLIDGMFDDDEATCKAVQLVLEADNSMKAEEVKKAYGKLWAAHVLCGSIFQWCDRAKGIIEEDELEKVWNESKEHWRDVAMAVDRIRWNSFEEEVSKVEATA